MGTWNSFTLYQHLIHNCCGGLQSFWAHFNLLSASAEPYYKQFAEWRRNKSSARHIRTLAHTRYNPPAIHWGSLLLWSTEVDGDDCYANSSYSTKECAEIPSRWCVCWGGIRKGGEETSTSVARPPSRVFPPTLKSSLSPKAHYSLLLLLMRRNLRVASKKKEKQLRKSEIVIIYNH